MSGGLENIRDKERLEELGLFSLGGGKRLGEGFESSLQN